MLPREMWGVYWEMFPDGRQELPATVPYNLWKAHMKITFNDTNPPPPPPIHKCYWSKLSSGPALTDRHKKPKTTPEPNARPPPVGPSPPVPVAFWHRYFAMFPRGHCPASTYEPADGKPAFDESQFSKPRYLFKRGTLCVRVSGEHASIPVYRASTGCDAFDAQGNWIGPG
jgi:hypothetical protein